MTPEQQLTQPLYKVISAKLESQNGGKFDWSDYLPTEDGKPGQWLPERDVSLCKSGWHVTPYPCMWLEEGSRIFEVETQGDGVHDCTGTSEKVAYSSIRLVRELTNYKTDGYRNSGNMNSGNRNSGNRNSGNRNSGNMNSGYRNSGNMNSGDWNSGYRNSGYRNSGYRNSGDWNSGDWNSGNMNSGDWNSGYRNSGYRNSGNWNSGNRNSGNMNSGNWNACDGESGHLNTQQSKTIRVFNKPCDRDVWNAAEIPAFFYDVDGSKDSWKKAWESASDREHEMVRELPNFDAAVWFELTGIEVEANA